MDLVDVLLEVLERDASDLHLTVGSPPIIRINGVLERLDYPRLSAMVDGALPTVAREGAGLDGTAAPSPPDGPSAVEGAGEAPPAGGVGASITSVVRIQVDKNVTVELAAGFDTITGELVDHLATSVARVMARHRGGT